MKSEMELRELDAWIAEHVMNRKDAEYCTDGLVPEVIIPGFGLFHPTTDPAANDAVDDAIIERLSGNLESYSVRKNADGNFIFRAIYKGEEFVAYDLEKKICRALFAQKLFTPNPES